MIWEQDGQRLVLAFWLGCWIGHQTFLYTALVHLIRRQ